MRGAPIRVAAARKAVATLRLNLLKNADPDEVRQVAFEIVQKEFAFDDDFSLDAVLARELGKTSWASFRRYGDTRNTTPALILQWIEKKGIPLDTQALFLNEHYPHLDTQPDQLADFMHRFDHGAATHPTLQEIKDLKSLFKQLTGFHYSRSFVKQYILPQEDPEGYF